MTAAEMKQLGKILGKTHLGMKRNDGFRQKLNQKAIGSKINKIMINWYEYVIRTIDW